MFSISEKSSAILADQMCIDLEHLKVKIESPEIRAHALMVCDVIDTLCNYVGEKTPEDVDGYCYSVMGDKKEEPYFVLDSIRMAFYRFISGGLKDLLVYQENEAWYPRIILREVLYPNDIDSLDDEFFIYRGCDVSEFESKEFGQSWTTSENEARDFALKHYASQDWFDKEKRIVVRSKCRKCDTLYSDQTTEGEFEIIINTNNLSNVENIT